MAKTVTLTDNQKHTLVSAHMYGLTKDIKHGWYSLIKSRGNILTGTVNSLVKKGLITVREDGICLLSTEAIELVSEQTTL